jgi:hypothetical protein
MMAASTACLTPPGLRRRVRLASRGTGERERLGAMHQPIENRVGDGGIAQVVVPALARQLTDDHGRPRAVAILEDLAGTMSLSTEARAVIE